MTQSAVGIKRGWREEVTGRGAGSAGGAAQGPLLLADMAKTSMFDSVSCWAQWWMEMRCVKLNIILFDFQWGGRLICLEMCDLLSFKSSNFSLKTEALFFPSLFSMDSIWSCRIHTPLMKLH